MILASDWLADSAATTHIARDKSNFINYWEEIAQIKVLPQEQPSKHTGQGTVPLGFKVNNKVYSVTLTDVKHTPTVPNNLISVGWLTDKGHIANFTTNSVEFTTGSGVIFSIGWKVRWVYQMQVRPKRLDQVWDFIAIAKGWTLDKWHWILGHVNP